MAGLTAAGWWRVWGLLAALLAALALAANEHYTPEYQTLAAVDWLVSQPPFDQAGGTPPARALAQDLADLLPGLEGSVERLNPVFGPPGQFQRGVGGLRDAAEVRLALPANSPAPVGEPAPVVHLRLVVFHRLSYAEAWADLTSTEHDLRRAGGPRQLRLTGPGEADRVWISQPDRDGPPSGEASIVGTRGPVAFEMVYRLSQREGSAGVDAARLSARAEQEVRGLVRDWSADLERAR